jgi:tryptophan-rich sensory protein
MNVPKLLTAISLCFAVAFVGSALTMPAINTWYQTLTKPPFTPPNGIFGPVWTLLYLLMAISFYLVWTSKAAKKKKRKAIHIFLAQLLMNLLWSLAFFGLQQPLLGVIVIIVLWGLIYKSITYFKPISPLASYLLYPYLAWVSFATILNLSIAVLNL